MTIDYRLLTLASGYFLLGSLQSPLRLTRFVACGKFFDQLAISLPVVSISGSRFIEIEAYAETAVAIERRIAKVIIIQRRAEIFFIRLREPFADARGNLSGGSFGFPAHCKQRAGEKRGAGKSVCEQSAKSQPINIFAWAVNQAHDFLIFARAARHGDGRAMNPSSRATLESDTIETVFSDVAVSGLKDEDCATELESMNDLGLDMGLAAEGRKPVIDDESADETDSSGFISLIDRGGLRRCRGCDKSGCDDKYSD
jgi:hypothetical protein